MRRQEAARVVSLDVPDERHVYDWMGKMAVVPSNLWLPKTRVLDTVASFAAEQGFTLYDASRMFARLGHDAARVDDAVVLLTQRSLKLARVLHFVEMDEYNVEAMVTLDILLQFRDVCAEKTAALVVGKHLLHAVCFLDGECIPMYDVKDARVSRSLLSQFERDSECLICLEDLRGRSTVVPFACGHPLCADCFYKNETLSACPKCRQQKRWQSKCYIGVSVGEK